MRVLLSIIVSTLGSLANLTAILGIIMFIFAAMGKQLFSVSFLFGAAAPKTRGREPERRLGLSGVAACEDSGTAYTYI